jgi:tetratricopeptide (TPR) repeat protein
VQWLGESVHNLLQSHLGQREIWWEISGTNIDLPPNLGVQPQWPVARVLEQGVPMPDPCAQVERSLCLNAQRQPVDPQVLPHAGDVFGGRWASAQWATIARLQASAGQWENAFYTYSQALALRPDSGAVRASMAVCLAAVGQNREALRLSEEALLADPFSRAAWRNGSRYAAELGDAAAAARLLAHGQRMGWDQEAESGTGP